MDTRQMRNNSASSHQNPSRREARGRSMASGSGVGQEAEDEEGSRSLSMSRKGAGDEERGMLLIQPLDRKSAVGEDDLGPPAEGENEQVGQVLAGHRWPRHANWEGPRVDTTTVMDKETVMLGVGRDASLSCDSQGDRLCSERLVRKDELGPEDGVRMEELEVVGPVVSGAGAQERRWKRRARVVGQQENFSNSVERMVPKRKFVAGMDELPLAKIFRREAHGSEELSDTFDGVILTATAAKQPRRSQ